MDRRSFLAAGALVALPSPRQGKRWQQGQSPWPICLDTATIRPADLETKVRIAAEACYDAIEPWDGELRDYERDGGSLDDLRKRILDHGLIVPSMIGLWDAIPATRAAFEASLAATRDRLRMAAAIGAQHAQVIPGPPRDDFDPRFAAACYRELLQIGLRDYSVKPALVFVKFLPGVRRLAQAAAIALDADHEEARIIPDVFHMHIGGSGFHGLRHLHGSFLAIFQCNDAPAEPALDALEDKHRVFPGDGVLPLVQCFRDLRTIAYEGCVSLELYNEDYYKRDLREVAAEGLRKLVGVIARAGV